MQVTDWLSAVLIGVVIGILGRLIIPGRQRIGVFVTLIIGVGSALLGGFVARWLNVDTKAPASLAGLEWDWIVFGIQVGFAVIGTALAAAVTHTRIAQNEEPKKRTKSRAKAAK
jgi:uncharacterized membrane protein YeaQ/YmgE (transglycosylase-associated protein family)